MKKSIISVITAAIVGVSSVIPAFAAPIDTLNPALMNTENDSTVINSEEITPRGIQTYKVTASTLNVRSGPGLDYAVIATKPYGSLVYTVSPVETEADGYTWLHVRYSGKLTGYVALEYLYPVID